MPGMKDICTSLFARSASADTQPRGGKLLLAQPFMDENYFSHSVVSLLDYDPKGGAMGVVLNHPSPSRLADLVDDCDVRTDIRVYCGGPLALDRLFFLHTLGADIIPGARPYMGAIRAAGIRFRTAKRLRRRILASLRAPSWPGIPLVAACAAHGLCQLIVNRLTHTACLCEPFYLKNVIRIVGILWKNAYICNELDAKIQRYYKNV